MINVNKVIKNLIGADLFFNTAMGFINPVFAIFLVQSIEGGNAKVVGIAMAILWLTKSTFRVPIAYFLDKKKGELDDFYSMVIGFFIFSLAYFLYLFARLPIHVYGIQFLIGLAGAFAFTPWYGFFSRHLDHCHENFEWGIEISLVGFGLAGASFIAGFVVDSFGFSPLFVVSGVLSLIGTFMLLFLGKNLKFRRRDGPHVRIKRKRK